MKRLLLATAAMAALTTGAGAADLGVPRGPVAAVVAAPNFSWTGFYVGAHLGYGFGNTRHVGLSPGAFDDGGVGETIRHGVRGVLGGIQFGHNWQTGNLVVGLEAELGYNGATGSRTGGLFETDVFGSARYSFTGFIGPRLGFAVDRALLYVKGGLAVATIRNIAADLDNGNTTFDPDHTINVTRTRAGWAIGGGLEYAFAPNWTAKVEYLYSNFGSFRTIDANGELYRHTNDMHAIKLGVNYLFSTGPAAVVARY